MFLLTVCKPNVLFLWYGDSRALIEAPYPDPPWLPPRARRVTFKHTLKIHEERIFISISSSLNHITLDRNDFFRFCKISEVELGSFLVKSGSLSLKLIYD